MLIISNKGGFLFMANLKLVKSATALVLGASVLTSAVAVSGTDASAKTTYKVTKKGTLVNAKTNKAVKGYKSYKGKLYKNGKKLTGTYKSVFYKSGVKFTGTYNKKYYVKGKLFTGKTSKNVYYKKGVKFTGVTSYGYTYKDGKRVEGEYKGKVYKNGKLFTGLYKDVLYTKGEKETGLDLYQDKLYKDGVLNVGLALHEGKLYKDADLNKGLVKHEDKWYNDAEIADGTYDDNGVERAIENGVEVGAKVKSVEAINGTTLQITFNKKVDEDTVIDSATDKVVAGAVNVTRTGTSSKTNAVNGTLDLNALDNSTAELSEDGRTLTVSLVSSSAAKFLDGTYTVSVKNIKDTAAKTIPTYSKVIDVDDTTAPVVESATYSASKGFVVKFSEPVTNPDVLRIDGEVVTGTLSNNNKTLTITKPASVVAGSTVSLYVASATDAAGNKVTPYTGSIVVSNDTTAVAVNSVTQLSTNKVRVVFNKPVNASALTGLTILKDSTSYTTFTSAKNTTVDPTGATFDITLGTSTSAPYFDLYSASSSKTDLVLAFAADSLKDYYGNALPAVSKSLTLTQDVAVPTVTSTKLSADGTYIAVKFNKELDSATLAKIDLRVNGAEIASSVASATVDTKDATILKVVPNASLTDATTGVINAGTYTVRLSAEAVTATNGVKSAAATLDNVVVDSSTTDLKVSSISKNGANNKIKVVFNKTVTAATALNPSNYTIDGVALTSAADIRFDGTDTTNKTVLIDLPKGLINLGIVGATTGAYATLGVSGVQTSTAQTLVATYDKVEVEDNTAATLKSASVVSPTVLKLTFDEAIDASSFALGDFTIKSAAGTFTATTTTATAVASGKSLVITFVPGTETLSLGTVLAGNNLNISLSSTNGLTDANGYGVNAISGLSVSK